MEENIIRKPKIPEAGYIFRHKENKDDFSRMLYLGDGVSIDDYEEIFEFIYDDYLAEQEKLAINEGGLM